MPEVRPRRFAHRLHSLWFAVVVAMVLLVAVVFVFAQHTNSPASPATAAQSSAETDEQRIADLVVANHILFDQGVLDGFGHVSVRSVKNPKHFYMARSLAPALVTKEEIFEFDENSQPIDPHGKRMYGERFIHGEIYRARPEVQAVVHSHSIAVVPFGTVNVPLRPIMHMAGFLPQQVPVFEIREVKGDDNGILIHDTIAGAALAKVLGSGPVALMRGHGMAVAGPDVRTAVFRAIYTQLDAQVEAQALALGNPKFLNAAEAANVNKVNEEVVIRAWELWAPHAELATAPFRANKP